MPEDTNREQSSYTNDINRIQDIINMLSQKDCDIDKMLDYVNEAAMLIDRCNQKLAKTGLQIDEAINKLNEVKIV